MRQLPLQGQLRVLGKPTKSESNVAAFAQYASDESKDLCSGAAPRTLQDLSQAGRERTSHSQLFPTTQDGESYFICSLRISGRGSVTEQPPGEGDRALPSGRACYQNYLLWDVDAARGRPFLQSSIGCSCGGITPVPVVAFVSPWLKGRSRKSAPLLLLNFITTKEVFLFGRKSCSPFN